MKTAQVHEIHPISEDLLSQGHPWITADEFSKEFPQDCDILEIGDFGFFLHDPQHPKIKARYWGERFFDFEVDLNQRLSHAVSKRRREHYFKERDNIYLCFGEADNLPGLFIQKLGKVILIQYQSLFWEKHLNSLKVHLQTLIDFDGIYTQKRAFGHEKSAPIFLAGSEREEFVIEEFGVKLQVKFNDNHDIGVYTDMSSIRSEIEHLFKNSKSVLNLFSYSGAFTLAALKHDCNVVSVDLSAKYMNYLEKNIKINEFDESLAVQKVMPVSKFFKNCDEKFDFIICDPPTSFTNGKKRMSVIDFYKKHLNEMLELLSAKGKLLVFINSHSVGQKKFKSNLLSVLDKSFEIDPCDYHLGEDCLVQRGFSEGNYLKGLLLMRKR